MIELIGGVILSLSASFAPGPAPAQPVQLETAVTDAVVTFRVTGYSPTAFRGRYAFKVVAGAGNRSTHAGRVDLAPDTRVTISTISVSVAPAHSWSATLEVTPEDGPPYVISSASP